MKKFYTFFGVISWYVCITVIGGLLGHQIGLDSGLSKGRSEKVDAQLEQKVEKLLSQASTSPSLQVPPLSLQTQKFITEATAAIGSNKQVCGTGIDVLGYHLYFSKNDERKKVGLPAIDLDGSIAPKQPMNDEQRANLFFRNAPPIFEELEAEFGYSTSRNSP